MGRVKAAETKENDEHKSFGTNITQERLAVINELYNSKLSEKVVDLYDEAAMDYRTTITSILQTSTDYLMELNKDLVSDVICVESYTVTKVL